MNKRQPKVGGGRGGVNVATRKGKSSSHDTREKNGHTQRSNATARRLKMYNEKPDRAKMRAPPKEAVVRIEPGRKWFNNTRIVTQENLTQFRETLAKSRNNPRSILLKATKLPISLFDHSKESAQKRASNLLTVSPFNETFSAARRQKRARLEVGDLASFVADVDSKNDEYTELKDNSLTEDLKVEQVRAEAPEAVMLKGTSRRIWGELYKVVDSSDVLIQVLDVRDPMGTRCYHLEKHLRKDRPFKKMVLLLNKCDLVPSWVTEKWMRILSKEYPVVAFKASMKHPFGKRSLIGLLRQYAEMLKNRKHVSVGLIGYPNVGKSSVINTLRGKKVCVSAPIPGQTKVWQYVDLTSKVYLIDCPGIVADDNLNTPGGGGEWTADQLRVIRGVVRAEKIESPEDYIEPILRLVPWSKFKKFYKLGDEAEDKEDGVEEDEVAKEDGDSAPAQNLDTASAPGSAPMSGLEVVEMLARKWGKLGKGGEPNITPVAIRIIQDLQRGKLPYFIPPPVSQDENGGAEKEAEEVAGAEVAEEEENVSGGEESE